MNEKGWFRTGWFVRDCKDCSGCATGRKLYGRLSSLSHPPGVLSFRFLPRLLARSYISHCGFEIIFMSRRQRLPRSAVCIRICSEDRRYRVKAYLPFNLELCNLANLVDCDVLLVDHH